MEKREILLQLIQHYASGSKTQFAKMVGLTPQGLSNMLARNTLDVKRFLTGCVNVNPDFLLTGEGPITLDAGVSTPTASPVASPQPLNNANLDQRINELLTISTNIYEMYKSVNDRLAEATAIITKSQQQFDRVLNLHDRISDRPDYGMVAEDSAMKYYNRVADFMEHDDKKQSV